MSKFHAWCTAAALGLMASGAAASGEWCRSKYGPNDEIGAANLITPARVLQATKLVKQGKTATLGKLYAGDIPFFGARGFLPDSASRSPVTVASPPVRVAVSKDTRVGM